MVTAGGKNVDGEWLVVWCVALICESEQHKSSCAWQSEGGEPQAVAIVVPVCEPPPCARAPLLLLQCHVNIEMVLEPIQVPLGDTMHVHQNIWPAWSWMSVQGQN